MGNSALTTNPIVLDTFTSVIDFSDEYPNGLKIVSIEWSKPTSTNHTFQILAGGSGGTEIFDEQCSVATQSLIKYLKGEHGVWTPPLYFAVAAGNEKASGKIIIQRAPR